MTTKALVLGGGGVTGIAWEIGLLAGLAEAGLDLGDADVLIGTSAGSVVATLVATGVPLEAAYASQIAVPTETSGSFGMALAARFLWTALWSRTPSAYAKRLGVLSVAAHTMPEDERRAVVAARLPRHDWPEKRLLVTAVDVVTGELKVFDRASGVPLVDAVTASCAVPGVFPPITIGGRRYMDGGMVSVTNANLAAGSTHVVVIAPMPAGLGPVPSAAAHAAELLRSGSKVTVVSPDAASLAAIGPKRLDVSRRPMCARAGRAQAASALAAIKAAWLGG